MSDLISRQAAIYAVCMAGCGSGHCGISCDDVKAIETLPSAQPELIRCKDCRWWDVSPSSTSAPTFHKCRGFDYHYTEASEYCSRAERRERETDNRDTIL